MKVARGLAELKHLAALINRNSNSYSIGNHIFKVLVQIHYSHPAARSIKKCYVSVLIVVVKLTFNKSIC